MLNQPQTNNEIRQWYINECSKIPELNEQWTKDGVSLKERAFKSWQFRHDRRLKGRAMMPDEDEREMLRRRDIEFYGTPNGPTFEFLVERLKAAGLAGNALFEAVIKGSYRTNAGIDKMLGF